jgi:hypothetical protein
MRITVRTGIIAASTWILIKMVFFLLDLFNDSISVAVQLNLLGLMVAISVGLYLQKRRDKEETNAMVDLKNAMSAGVPYTIIVSIFIYFFYQYINPEYYQHQIAENEISIEKMINDPIQLKKFQEQNEDAEVMTKEQIEQKLKENNRKGASAGFTATLSVLALLLVATLSSLLITIIYRKVVFKKVTS